MSQIDLTTFGNLLADAYRELGNKLPDVEIPANTTLGYAVEKMRENYAVNEEDGTQAILNVVEDFQSAMGDEFLRENGLEDIDKLSGVFEERIRHGFNDLKDVRATVDELKQQIDSRVDQQIDQDPFLHNYYYERNKEVSTQFSEIDWSPIYSIGVQDKIISELNQDTTEHRDARETKMAILKRMSRKTLEKVDRDFEDIDISQEAKDKIAQNLVEKTGRSSDIVYRFLNQVVNYKDGVRRIKNLAEKAGTIRGAMDTCTTFLSSVEDYNMLVQYTLDDVELSDKTKDKIQNNLELIEDLVKLMTYYLIHCRTQIFHESLVLPNGQLNPDNKDDYFESGGTQLKLHQYINLFYGDKGLRDTRTGITLQNAKQAEQMINEKLKEEDRDQGIRAKAEYRKILRESFIVTLDKYISEGTDESIPRQLQMTQENARSMIRTQADSVINNTPIEDALYTVILKAYYKNEFVRVLYQRIGLKSMEMISRHNEIEKKDIQLIETKVVTEMIAEFVMNSGLTELKGV